MPKRWIPNILTVINLCAGVVAILLALAHQWALAVGLIFGAAFFDSLDGRVARRLNIASEYGKKLDLLADLVSFGVAPAVLTYLLVFTQSGWGAWLLVAVFPACGALRLARVRIASVKGYYIGLPLAAAGPILAASAYLAQVLPAVIQAVILLALSALMVSTVKLPKM
jgi:CDP-diacylglycerol--serine O-phosphatidyltransferase